MPFRKTAVFSVLAAIAIGVIVAILFGAPEPIAISSGTALPEPRRVADFELKEIFNESPVGLFQDWIAAHVNLPDTRRIVRLYPIAPHLPADQKSTLQRAAEKEFISLQDLLHPGIVLAETFTQHELGPALRGAVRRGRRPGRLRGREADRVTRAC